MSDRDIFNLCGRCGIMTACLTDPLSQCINKISGSSKDDMNAVGFYYETTLHGITKTMVTLFNVYDSDPIPWLRLGYTMNLFLGSPFVTKITFYPLVKESTGPILTRNRISVRSSTQMEDSFRATVIQTIEANAKSSRDKNISYTCFLLRNFGITSPDVDRLISSILTGYTLVNTVLLNLMGIDRADESKIGSSIIPCPLLSQPVTFSAPHESSSPTDTKYIIEESRREITKLAAVFVDLFTSHSDFQQNILSIRSSGSTSSDIEDEFVCSIVEGLHAGCISNSDINQLISDLNKRRPAHKRLPLSLAPQSEVKILDESIMCTFQQPPQIQNTDPLKQLGQYLQHIVDMPSDVSIDVGTLVSLYNQSIHKTSLQPVKVSGSGTRSQSGIIIQPGVNHTLNVPINNMIVPIPMHNCDVTTFTFDQLMDILVYIDSLRSDDTPTDTRYAHLQNEITRELANRQVSDC